jgi:CubicO group peptidase (beta-lactamase class C family)
MLQYGRNIPASILATALVLCLTVLHGCSDSSDSVTSGAQDPNLSVYNDPGSDPWVRIQSDALIEECGLDPDILATVDETAPYSYAIIRYGKLCHEFYHPDKPGRDEIARNASATKTLAATVFGRAVTMSADLPRPLSDMDRMDKWISDITFNQDALVAHVLAMVGFNESLAWGQRKFVYDADGSREINRLSDVVEAVIAQDPEHFGGASTTGEFAQREMFDRLGMRDSYWDGERFAVDWDSTLLDMARLGVLLVHEGVWDQQRLVSEEWIYKMTHPAFEDTNTGYGYLTWLAANRNFSFGLGFNFQQPLGTCQPPAIWREFPHPPSESTDCNYNGAYSCLQPFDVGVFAAMGAGGQLIVGHRGLDLVIVTRDAGRIALPTTPWDMIRSALIKHDPVYQGDEEAFCAAYREGEYAPDLIPAP